MTDRDSPPSSTLPAPPPNPPVWWTQDWPAPPPSRPGPPKEPRPPDPAPRRLLAFALAGGLAFELGLRGGVANGLVALGLGVIVFALVTDGRLPARAARRSALAALIPMAFLAVRTSPWLVAANLAAIGVLLSAAVGFGRSGTITNTTPLRVLRRLGGALPLAWSAPRTLGPAIPRLSGAAGERASRVGRGLLLAVPILGIVVLLLASADAVFASFFTPDIHAGTAAGHLVLLVVFALVVVIAVGAAAADTPDAAPTGTFGLVEVTTALALAVGVLGLFVLSQLVALTATGRQLVASSGLTPAQYARSGFFQLCWAIAIVLGYLALIRGLAKPEVMRHRLVRCLAAAVPILTLGLVAVSLRRMALYDQAFGLTMLRLAVVGAAAWAFGVLVMVALRNAGFGPDRNWVTASAVGTALMFLLAANVANPEAFIVRHNVARAHAGADLDGSYLENLSDDAVGALADVAAREQDQLLRRQLVAAARCGQDRTGAAALNVGAASAAERRGELCAVSASRNRANGS